MRNSTIFGAVLLSVTLATASANAADIARPVYKAPPAPVATYSWTGFYVGGNIGWYQLETDMAGSFANAATAGGGGLGGACFLVGACPQTYGSSKGNGVIGGAQIGYNWQAQQFVWGVEADIQFNGGKSSVTLSQSNAANAFTPFTGTHTTDQDWLGTVRGRAGVLWTPNLLAYATGGFAYAHVERTWTAAFATAVPTTWSGSGSDTLFGWTVGGGLEWALGNGWSLGGEYLFVKLDGGDSFLTTTQTGACDGTNCLVRVTPDDVTEHIVRAKLNYKFGWGL